MQSRYKFFCNANLQVWDSSVPGVETRAVYPCAVSLRNTLSLSELLLSLRLHWQISAYRATLQSVCEGISGPPCSSLHTC